MLSTGKCIIRRKRVESLSIEQCLKEFCEWFKQFNKPLLVCRNGRAFDSIILLKSSWNCSHTSLPVDCFVDSLHVFKEVLHGRKCYKPETLVKGCSSLSYKAHSPLEDVQALQSLVVHLNISSAALLKHSFSVQYVVSSIHYKAKTNGCLESLQPLSNTVSNYMLRKIAQSGLIYQNLKRRTRGEREHLELNKL